MSNNIDTLREHLFKTLSALSDKENPMDIDRAKAISNVSQTIINSAMIEIKHAQLTGSKTSTFLENKENVMLPSGITGITQHRIKG